MFNRLVHHVHHDIQRMRNKGNHGVHVLDLLFCESLLGVHMQAIQSTAKVITGITYGLQLRYLTHHALYLRLGFA